MSYKLLSNHPGDAHDLSQWDGRTLDGELAAYEGRTLIASLDRHLPSGSRVLEAGCGFGGWCEWLLRRGYDPVGVEYHPDIVQRSIEFNPRTRVTLGDVTDLQFHDATFDAYISLGVLEHFEEGPQAALAEAVRVMKPGAVAFITTPLLSPVRRYLTHPVRSTYFALQRLRGRPGRFWEYRFTVGELTGFVEAAGLQVVESTVDDYDPRLSTRHIGLWADWFFLRSPDGIWELNGLGRAVHWSMQHLVPAGWFAAGWLIVARKPEG